MAKKQTTLKRKSSARGLVVAAAEPVGAIQLPAGVPLIDREAAAATVKHKKPRARSSEASINKALHDNFIKKGFSVTDLDLLVSNGMSIRQHVQEAKRRQEAGEAVIGKCFYQELRAAFMLEDNPRKSMKVDDPSQPQDARIAEACAAIVGSKMDMTLCAGVLQQNYLPPNQKNAKALFAVWLEVPFGTDRGAAFLCQALAYVKRNRLDETYPLLWAAVKEHMDRALERSYVSMKTSGLSPSTWYTAHEPYVGLIVQQQALGRCIKNATKWDDVQDDLVEVCKSHCGRRIFSSKLAALSAAACSRRVAQVVAELDQKDDINQQVVDEVIQKVDRLAKESGREMHSSLGQDYEVSYTYGGFDCKTRVTTLFQEAMVQIFGKVKTWALHGGVLGYLWCEQDMVVPLPAGAPCPRVCAELVRGSKNARAAARDMLESGSGQDIKTFLLNKDRLLYGFDLWWRVERDFWNSIVGPTGEERMKTNVLAALPSVANEVTPAQALQNIEALEKSKLFEFVGVGCQSIVSEVTKIVRSIAGSRPPVWPVTNADYLVAVRERCGAFVRHRLPAGARQAPETLVGRSALKRKLTAAAEKKQGPGLSYDDIAVFRIFGWLLDPEDKTNVDGWLVEMTGEAHAGASVAAAAAKSKGSSAKKAKLDEERAKASKTRLEKLFK